MWKKKQKDNSPRLCVVKVAPRSPASGSLAVVLETSVRCPSSPFTEVVAVVGDVSVWVGEVVSSPP